MLASTIRRLILYARTHAFTSECRILRAPFRDPDTDRSYVSCDSCDGPIGGPRLSCLDCSLKSTTSNSLDLCCAPQCVGARIAYRQDLESAHEPSHGLVKFRTTMLRRSKDRVQTAACGAFERVEGTRRKIAKLTSHPDEETGPPDEQKTSTLEQISTEMPARTDSSDNVFKLPEGIKGGAEVEGKSVRDTKDDQLEDESLPTCGKCKGRLSFPFWYCIFCEG
jgi:hypothetical protein